MKIAIIGGGIAGSSAAIYLANLGLDVHTSQTSQVENKDMRSLQL
jgi:uncharacterized protein with NAD-binding domain and iron-sulfur cluster